MRTSNPVFASIERSASYSDATSATYAGITLKTFILFAVAVLSGYISLTYIPIENYITVLIASAIIAFIAVLVGFS